MSRPTRVLLVVCVATFMASLDLFIVNIAFPDIAHDFGGTSLSSLSWILNAYAIVFAALLVPAGRWADAVGRRRAFLLGLGLFLVASAACAAAPSVGLLVAARVVQAAGGALLMPTSLGLLLPEFPPERRPVAVAIWAAVGAVAAAAGPPIGGLLVEASWRWVFLVNLPVGLVALVAAARVLREVRDPAAGRPDTVGALLVAAGIAALVGGIVEGPDWGWGDPRVAGAFAAAALLLGAVVVRTPRVASPVIDPALLRIRSFAVASVASLLFFAGFGAMLLGNVLLLTGPWHEDVLTAGLMIAPGPFMAAAASVPGARLAANVGARAVGLLGVLLFAGAHLWWALRMDGPHDFAGAFLPANLVAGAGVGLVIPTLTAVGASGLPPERFATGAAVLAMARQIGVALGVALFVAALGNGATAGDFADAWTLVIGAALAAAVAFATLGATRTAAATVPTTPSPAEVTA